MSRIPNAKRLINILIANNLPEHSSSPKDLSTNLQEQRIEDFHVILVMLACRIICCRSIFV